MKLDVKNLTFGAVGETDSFDLDLKDYKLAEGMIATSLKGKIKLTRLDESILVQADGAAVTKLDCDRCLAEFEATLPFAFSREYFVGGFRENKEDLLVSKHFEIDIEEPLREEVLLALPVQRLCRKDCRGLCAHCGADLNTEECSCGKEVNKKV